jgi:hypothetical protein
MKLCEHNCGPLCDSCIYFAFNGEEWVDDNGRVWPNAVYVGKGKCLLRMLPKDPEDGCNDFVCRNTERQSL